jgi:phage shock protein C
MTEPRHTKFYRDEANGKWMGVCAGIADYTGMDVNLVRAGAVLLTIFALNIGGLIAYFAVGWMTPAKPRELVEETPERAKFWRGVRRSPRTTIRDVRSRFRDLDRRLADIETYVTSSDTRLAREIEQLR